jgi:hypothetical protein
MSKDSHKKSGYQNGQKGSYGKPNRGGKGPSNTVRFFVNRGVNQGATPGRILAELCRRGKVNGGDIGFIAIHPNASTFDVRSEVSVQFEENVGLRDSRDPNTLIRRDRGPMPSSEKIYTKKPYGSKPSSSKHSASKPAGKKTFKREGRTNLRARSLSR